MLETEYRKRLSKVFQFIDENLQNDLKLEQIAEVAHFSSYHFHRVFKYITQETLNAYITRKRIEKAADSLLHKNLSISETGYQWGFKDPSSFSRSFKKFYGISPKAFIASNTQKHSKIRQLVSKNGQDYLNNDQYFSKIDELKKWTQMNANIDITSFDRMNLAYIDTMGPQTLSAAFHRLLQWAIPKDLHLEPNKVMTVYHDSFKFTAPEKVRMSASIWTPEPVTPQGEVAVKSMTPGKCIRARFEIEIQDFEKSWTSLFVWMNDNGYKKSAQDPFEIYHNNFNEHPDGIAIVDFCIPIL